MKILLIVDYQYDFVAGSLGFDGAEKLDAGIVKEIENPEYDAVVVTYDTHPTAAEYLKTREGIALPIPHTEKNTPGWALYGDTKMAISKCMVKKPVYILEKPTFAATPHEMIKIMGAITYDFPDEEITEIKLCGLVTNMCVISQAVCWQGAYPNAQIVVDASLTDSFNKDLYEKTLDVMEGMQIKVINRK